MLYCAGCGSELAPGSRFCAACGAPAQPGSLSTGDVSGTGIAIGAGASATVTQGVSGDELVRLFAAVHDRVDAREDDPAVDKGEVHEAVGAIQEEASKGEEADLPRLRRWLNRLAEIAPDVLTVTATALLDPLAGVAEGVRQIAAAMRE